MNRIPILAHVRRRSSDTIAEMESRRLERDSNAEIEAVCRKLGGKLIRVQSGHVVVRGGRHMELAETGTPDRLLLLPDGLAIWLEQKRPGGRLSVEQIEWHEWARQHGHHVATIESAADVVRAVNEARKENS